MDEEQVIEQGWQEPERGDWYGLTEQVMTEEQP
jgi:hypothetical protein